MVSFGVVGSDDVGHEGCLGDELADAIDGRLAPEGVVRPLPVLEVLPFGQAVGDVGALEVDGRPELLERGALGSLDLAVEVLSGAGWAGT